MAYAVVLIVALAVLAFVTVPLRRPRPATGAEQDEDLGEQLRELEAAREAKYREIRDAELDHRTGKLSDADFEAVDGALRAEAVAILRRLEEARERLGSGEQR
jgi:flagellar biosynthesis/type III secretory pathway M-ring protein FliF/YscJ